MALVKMSTGYTWAMVGHLLSLPPNVARHVARKGKQELMDEVSFMTVLRNVAPPAGIDWREREHQAITLLGHDASLAAAADAVGARHIEPCLLREYIWSGWAYGHPWWPSITWPASKNQRARAANQRRRWRPEHSARLLAWLDIHLTHG